MSEKKRKIKKLLRNHLLGADGRTQVDGIMKIIWSKLEEESEKETKKKGP